MRLAAMLLIATASASFGGTALAQAPEPAAPAPAAPTAEPAAAAPIAEPAPAAPIAEPVPMTPPVDPCRSTPACAADGMCTYWGGYCVAATSADCAASAGCLGGGRCQAQEGHCVPAPPATPPLTPRQTAARKLRVERNRALDTASDVALGGLGAVGVAWATMGLPTLVIGAGVESERALEFAIPVFGPWLAYAESDSNSSGAVFAVSGVLQGAAALTALGGGIAYAVIANESSPVAHDTTAQPRLAVVPLASPSVLGLGAAGRF